MCTYVYICVHVCTDCSIIQLLHNQQCSPVIQQQLMIELEPVDWHRSLDVGDQVYDEFVTAKFMNCQHTRGHWDRGTTEMNDQSIKFLLRQYPLQIQARWRDRQISVQQQNRRDSFVTSMCPRACQCHWERAKSQRCDIRCFLKVATEMAERTGTGGCSKEREYRNDMLLRLCRSWHKGLTDSAGVQDAEDGVPERMSLPQHSSVSMVGS